MQYPARSYRRTTGVMCAGSPEWRNGWIPQEQQPGHARWAIQCTDEEPQNILAGQIPLSLADNLWQLVELAVSARGAEAPDVEPGALRLRNLLRVHQHEAQEFDTWSLDPVD